MQYEDHPDVYGRYGKRITSTGNPPILTEAFDMFQCIMCRWVD